MYPVMIVIVSFIYSVVIGIDPIFVVWFLLNGIVIKVLVLLFLLIVFFVLVFNSLMVVVLISI